jgi:hypothetical protein
MAVIDGIITTVMPPGGWHYPQQLAGERVIRITGFTFEQLLEAMAEFRRRHSDLCGGAQTANRAVVIADLKNYLCAHFRQNCADSPQSPYQGYIGVTKAMSYARPIDRVANWLVTISQQRPAFVEPALAAQRAQICAQCPQNIHWATGCGPCNDNVSVRTQNIKGSLSTPFDRHLFACRVFGHSNEVAVWLKDAPKAPEHPPPGNCWLKD